MDGKIAGVRFGWVVNNVDDTGADRIAVRLVPEDNSKPYDESIEVDAIPLLPKMFRVVPRIGEGVFVLLSTANDGYSQRHYIGPVISQPHKMYFEPAQFGGDTYQRGAKKDFDVNPLLNEDAIGAYPTGDDIAIVGRRKCDIILKDDDIRIRAGVKLVDPVNSYDISFNTKNPAYIKLKHYDYGLVGENKSSAAIVADKIMLLSNKSADPIAETTDREDLITNEEMNRLLSEAYKLPYGEKLVNILKQMIDIFNTHTHDYVALPPNAAFVGELNAIKRQYLDGEQPPLLSDSIRIN